MGIDSISDYYDVKLKQERLSRIETLNSDWTFVKGSIADKACIDCLFAEHEPSVVVNLAAQAGVRYSITNPDAFKDGLRVCEITFQVLTPLEPQWYC